MTTKYIKAKFGDVISTIVEDMSVDSYDHHCISLDGSDFVTPPVKLINNLSIMMYGSTVYAKRGAYPIHAKRSHRGACVLDSTTKGVNNFWLIGPGSVSMERLYMYAENWGRHCVSLEQGRNIYIRDVELRSGCGDCMQIGRSHPCYNVQLKRVRCHRAHRNCISVCNVVGLLMRNVSCEFAESSGVDIEPGEPLASTPGGHIQQVRLYDTLSWFNGADGVQIDPGKSPLPSDIYINRYKSKGNGGRHISINNYHPTAAAKSRLVVKNIQRL